MKVKIDVDELYPFLMLTSDYDGEDSVDIPDELFIEYNAVVERYYELVGQIEELI